MRDPWQIMNLQPDADAAAIRRRYLELVRMHSPEHDPERFNEIRDAYELLNDPVKLVKLRLFREDRADSPDQLIGALRERANSIRIPTSSLLHLADID